MEILQKIRFGNIVPAVAAGAMFYGDEKISGEYVEPTPAIDWSQEYVCFESLEDGNVIHFTIGYGVNASNATSCSWSKDKVTWNTTNVNSTTQDITVSLDKGEKVYWKGVLPSGGCWRTGSGGDYPGLARMYGTKKFNLKGNLMSMCYGDDFIDKTSLSSFGNNVFSHFFLGSSGGYDANPTANMVDLRDFYMPAVTLANAECYSGIFRSNNGLLYPPKSIHVDNSKTVGLYGLFLGCTILEETPILNWEANGSSGVLDMLKNCRALKRIAAIGTTANASWHQNLPSSGIFYKNANVTWQNYVPSGWTIRNWDADNIMVIDAKLPVEYAGYVKGLTQLAQDGDSVTLEFVGLNGYTFNGWKLNGQTISTSNPYTFTVSGDATFDVDCSL